MNNYAVIICPHCGEKVEVYFGQKIFVCPKCGMSLDIPLPIK